MALIRANYKAILFFIFFSSILWIAFAPLQLGGQVSYIIINGNSMEPDIQLGDLVVTRKSTGYEIDQRVAYINPKVGYVFHRIVGREGEEFVLQGDNNDWLDTHHPERSEILGSYWFKIPRGGIYIRKLREPAMFAGLVIGMFLIVLTFSGIDPQSGEKKRKQRRHKMDKKNPGWIIGLRQELLSICGILIIIALILGGIAYSRPATREIKSKIVYVQEGELNYSSEEQALIYNSAKIKTGDPVYTNLMCEVQFVFNYGFSSMDLSEEERSELTGEYQIDVRLSDVDGWNRSYQMVPVTKFAGDQFQSELDIDICNMQTIFLDKETKTGVEIRAYDLTILPSVSISGSVQRVSFRDSFEPSIHFQIDRSLLRFPEEGRYLNMNKDGIISVKRITENIISIFGRFFPISQVKNFAAILLGTALLASIYPAQSLLREIRRSDSSRIHALHQSLLIDVEPGSLAVKGTTVIEVDQFADLLKLAERYGAMIFHETGKDFHRYSIQDDQTLFQYTLEEKPEQKD
jgi:signal peptidase I